MKRFFEFIPNKAKAVYVIWLSIHFITWITTGVHWLTLEIENNSSTLPFSNLPSRVSLALYEHFYPFVNYESFDMFWGRRSELDFYDISELIVYSFVPIVMFYVYYLIKTYKK